jgi:hypothetical protein
MDRLTRQRLHGLRRTVASRDPTAPARRWTEMVSLAVAVLAMAVAGLTYIDQRDLKQLTESHEERRYASRVFWWTEPNPKSDKSRWVLHVQNRAPAPVHNVSFVGRQFDVDPQRNTGVPGWESVWTVGDLAPCKIGRFELKLADNVVLIRLEKLDFIDGQGQRWIKRIPGGLAAIEPGTVPDPRVDWETLQPLSSVDAPDCTDS